MDIPAINGNWVDFIILIVLAFYIAGGFKKGFIYGMLDTIGFLLSLILALRFYPVAAKLLIDNFSLSKGIANVIGFLVIAILSEPIFYIITTFIDRYFDKKVLLSPGGEKYKKFLNNRVNLLLGFIPATLSCLILVAFMLTTLLALPVRPDVKQAITNSKIGGAITEQTLGLERNLSDIFGGAVQETMNFLTIKPQGTESINLKFKTSTLSIDSASEEKMLELVNNERAKNGLQTLSKDFAMLSVAQAHCKDMFQRGYFSHYSPEGLSPFDRVEQAGIQYRAAGENLAYAPTVEIAHKGLMDSPGHRKNILSPDFGRVGIGVISAGIYGKMWCQEFRD